MNHSHGTKVSVHLSMVQSRRDIGHHNKDQILMVFATSMGLDPGVQKVVQIFTTGPEMVSIGFFEIGLQSELRWWSSLIQPANKQLATTTAMQWLPN